MHPKGAKKNKLAQAMFSTKNKMLLKKDGYKAIMKN